MREYVFLLEYDRGVHSVRDVFIDHPVVVATALTVSITLDSGWRVDVSPDPSTHLMLSNLSTSTSTATTVPIPRQHVIPSSSIRSSNESRWHERYIATSPI